MYSTCVYAKLLNGPTIYRKLGNANIARTYIDTHQRLHPKFDVVEFFFFLGGGGVWSGGGGREGVKGFFLAENRLFM